MRVDETRPYEPLGMTTKKWMQVPLTLFSDIEGLVFSQEYVSLPALLNFARGAVDTRPDLYPYIVWYNGLPYLVDGHNRVTYYFLTQGFKPFLARVIRR